MDFSKSLAVTVYVGFIFCFLTVSCDVLAAKESKFPFRNDSLPWETRVNDLVDRLTLSEMIQQMSFGGGGCRNPTPAIPRLGIKPYNFDTECLHGVMMNPATAFPQAVGLAATFSPEVLFRVGEVIATEARAIFNNATAHGDYGIMKSVSCLAPFINIMRHPLWGRVQEVYGEDPFLTGVLAGGYVRGLQGDHPRYVRANAGCKTVDAHSGPENIPTSRFTFNTIVSKRDLRLTYLPHFKDCIDAGSYNLMCSYNSINGVPACANKWLMTEVMRKEFGFRGYFISDAGAIGMIHTSHKYVNSTLGAAVAAVRAGVNLDLTMTCDSEYLQLQQAVDEGLVSWDLIRERVKPLFYIRLRLGEFDPPERNPYAKISTSAIQSSAHRETAVDVATKTFVLLKNDGLLPIRERLKTLAIIGPMSDDLPELYGNYNPDPVAKFGSTPYQGLRGMADDTRLTSGCDNNLCQRYNSTRVKEAVTGADLVIVCLGTGISVEAEGKDRSDMNLPGKQLQLLQDAVKFAGDSPVLLLLFSAGPVDISWPLSSPPVLAILQCFFPAQATGEALSRVLGLRPAVVSPSGRLPYTWPASLDQVLPITNYSMAGRTYRYFDGNPLLPFGFGLSYTKFSYSDLEVPAKVVTGDNVKVTVMLANTGDYHGDEVAQVYVSWVDCRVAMPQLQLVSVLRQSLSPGDKVKVTLVVRGDRLLVWDDKQGFVPHYGGMRIWVGGQQPNQKVKVPSNVLQTTFTIIQR